MVWLPKWPDLCLLVFINAAGTQKKPPASQWQNTAQALTDMGTLPMTTLASSLACMLLSLLTTLPCSSPSKSGFPSTTARSWCSSSQTSQILTMAYKTLRTCSMNWPLPTMTSSPTGLSLVYSTQSHPPPWSSLYTSRTLLPHGLCTCCSHHLTCPSLRHSHKYNLLILQVLSVVKSPLPVEVLAVHPT